ncbi:MAG: SMP-30/gluconolactonase/LRE family protein [Williamsia sp.]|nr:SMP-30/gluconolactonase/LRE family protein [Williamsia sp.]
MTRKLVSLAIFSVCMLYAAHAQQHRLTKLWSTDSALKVPESVLIDPQSNVLYVSNIDGKADEKDGKGSIGKVSADGKIIAVDWVSGLHAPKGMGIRGNNLYVADLDAIAIIDTKKGTLTKRIPVQDAVFLNDVTVDKSGVVYVSDSRAGKVFRMQGEKVELYLDKLKNPNGLLANGNDFYLLDSGTLYLVDKNKNLVKIVEGMEPDTDGIVPVKAGEFIVSCWGGSVYYVHKDGNKQKLLDTREQKINTADIQYDPAKAVLYIPTFYRNSITAYKVQ